MLLYHQGSPTLEPLSHPGSPEPPCAGSLRSSAVASTSTVSTQNALPVSAQQVWPSYPAGWGTGRAAERETQKTAQDVLPRQGSDFSLVLVDCFPFPFLFFFLCEHLASDVSGGEDMG